MQKLLAGSLFAALLGFAPVTLFVAPAQAQPRFGVGVRVGFAPPPMRVEVRGMAPSPGHVWLGGHWRYEGGRHVWWPGRWELPPQPGYAWIAPRWGNVGGMWEFQPGRWAPPGVVVGGPVYAPPPQPVYDTPPPPQPVYAPPPQPVYAPPPQPVYAPPPQPAYAAPPPGQEVVVETAPPPPQQEVIPIAPSPQHVWIGGHWRWDPMMRRHIWAPGYYQLGQPGMRWVPAHWDNNWGRYRYVPGHWRPM